MPFACENKDMNAFARHGGCTVVPMGQQQRRLM
jgi:hypothetical protein